MALTQQMHKPCLHLSSRRICAARPCQPVHRRLLISTRASLNDDGAAEPRVASVQVDLGSAVEQITVPLTHPSSRLVQAEMRFPLGFVLEKVDDQAVITEVTQGSAAAAAGCRVGDVLRATTAMTMQMTYPAMNIMFGGVGRPKLVKMLLATNKVPFPKVMDAVRSNSTAAGGDGIITVVLERVDVAAAANVDAPGSRDNRRSSENGKVTERELATASAGTGKTADDVFDPKIFE